MTCYIAQCNFYNANRPVAHLVPIGRPETKVEQEPVRVRRGKTLTIRRPLAVKHRPMALPSYLQNQSTLT